MKAEKAIAQRRQRNPNLEVFRCLLMFFIVLYHCCLFNAWTPDVPYKPQMYVWMLPFSALLIWHVDAFVAISGWFGIKFSWVKALRLYGLVLFYSAVSLVVSVVIMKQPLSFRSVKVDGGWFTATYLGLMLVSPLLNAAVDWLGKDLRKLWVAVSMFALMMFLNWVPTHLYSAVVPCGVGGSTLVNFMFIYVLARAVKLTVDRSGFGYAVAMIGGGFGLMFIVLAMTVVFSKYRLGISSWTGLATECQWAFTYDAPYVLMIAVGMLLAFASIENVPSWLGRLCMFVAPSTFAIYLLHGPSSFGHVAYRSFQGWFSSQFGWHPVAVIIVSAVVVFVGCLCIDLVRRGMVVVIRRCRSALWSDGVGM